MLKGMRQRQFKAYSLCHLYIHAQTILLDLSQLFFKNSLAQAYYAQTYSYKLNSIS